MSKTLCNAVFTFVWPLSLLVFAISTLPSIQGTDAALHNITCHSLKDCEAINGSVCAKGLCACPDDRPIFVTVKFNETVDESYCLESFNETGTTCSFSQQCDFPHGVCQNQICSCERRYTADDNTGTCVAIETSNLVPIVVGGVLGGLVIITLIAYFWMSRKKK